MARYQYETSPKKLQQEYETKKVKNKKKLQSKPKNNKKVVEKSTKKSQVKLVFYVIIGFGVLFTISYRNSLINESFSKNQKLRTSLTTMQKENEQLNVNIEDSLNLKTIEQSAKELLGMQRLENSQKVYVNLPKQDYVEPASEEIIKEEQSEGIFGQIINFILGK